MTTTPDSDRDDGTRAAFFADPNNPADPVEIPIVDLRLGDLTTGRPDDPKPLGWVMNLAGVDLGVDPFLVVAKIMPTRGHEPDYWIFCHAATEPITVHPR